MSTLTHSPAWNALQDHRTTLSGFHLRDLFDQDEGRFDKFSLLFNDILIDYSKQPINSESMALLMTLARQQGLEEWIGKMFRGERVNNTENRAALHVALRGEGPFHLDGVDITLNQGRDIDPVQRDHSIWTGSISRPWLSVF